MLHKPQRMFCLDYTIATLHVMYFQSLQKSLFQPSSSVTIAQSAESQGEKANSSSDRKLPTPPQYVKLEKLFVYFFFFFLSFRFPGFYG